MYAGAGQLSCTFVRTLTRAKNSHTGAASHQRYAARGFAVIVGRNAQMPPTQATSQ